MIPKRKRTISAARYNDIFLLFVLAYVGLAVAGNLTHPGREIFPFFSWSLFSHVPANGLQHEILILQVDDQNFDPPVNFYEKTDIFPAARSRDITPLKIAGKIIRKVQSGDQDEANYDLRYLARKYFPRDTYVKFQVVLTRSDPIARWRGDAVPELVTVYVESAVGPDE